MFLGLTSFLNKDYLLIIFLACVIPQRYVLCFMIFLGITMAYSMRVCLHIAITKMVVLVVHNETHKDNSEVCPGSSDDIKIPGGGIYNWTEKDQGIILAAFFPGYMVTHLPGGIASDKFGGKHIFSAGIAMSAIITILVPVTVEFGSWWGLTILRFVIGLSQGSLVPSMATLLVNWVPKRERGRLITLVSTGVQVGTISGNLVSSLLMAYAGGWITVFYFWGVLSLVWYFLFIVFCYSEPAQHPFITEKEAVMLADEIGSRTNFKIPWKKIISHLPIWALMVSEVGHDWIFYLVVVELPKYMSDVLKFNIKENGVFNAIPYLALMICSSICGAIADMVINKNLMSVLNARKLFTTIGAIGPGICIVLVSYMGCNGFVVGPIFVVCMVTMGPYYAGMKVNILDVTKSFAGVVMAIINGIGSVAFAPVPSIIAHVTSDYSLDEWRKVFWVLFGTSIVTNAVYVIWASAERAEWDKNPSEL